MPEEREMLRISFCLLGFVFACVRLATAAPDFDREIILAPHAGGAREDLEIARWQERARDTKAAREIFERLGWAFVAKARRTLEVTSRQRR